MATATFSLRGGPLNTPEAVPAFTRSLSRFANYFLACLRVARQRRQLLKLDDRALKDIGISSADADAEATRGFWNIPEDIETRD